MFARLMPMFMGFMTSRLEGAINSSILVIAQNFLNRGKQVLLLMIASFVFSVLFSAGIIISILEASSQYDTKGFIFLSAMLTSSLSLSALSLIVLIALYWPRRSASLTFIPRPQEQSTSPQTSLEEILALIFAEVFQFLKDKKAEDPAANNSQRDRHQTKSRPHSHATN